MIIFWTKEKYKEYGPVDQFECSLCKKTWYWNLYSIQKKFTLFFVPLFNISSRKIIRCPHCGGEMKINQKDWDEYLPLAQINQDFLDKKISEEERAKKLQKMQ